MSVFNEDTRVKILATIQFLRIGYNYQSLREADIDFNIKIFINRFKLVLEKLNGRDFTYDEIKMIINDINALIKNNDLEKEFYNWLINPFDKVTIQKENRELASLRDFHLPMPMNGQVGFK